MRAVRNYKCRSINRLENYIHNKMTSVIDNSNEITVTWENLTVRVPLKKDNSYPNAKTIDGKPMRTLVENLSGIAKPSEIIGLLGPSGSGKTVLLNILSSRLHLPSGSVCEKNVYINKKQPLTRDLFGKVAAYVMQDDELLETMTPYECLKFSANLRLSCTPQEKEQRVMKVIEDMRLTACMNTLVTF